MAKYLTRGIVSVEIESGGKNGVRVEVGKGEIRKFERIVERSCSARALLTEIATLLTRRKSSIFVDSFEGVALEPLQG